MVGRAFEALGENQNLSQKFEKFGRVFQKLGHMFVL